LIHHSQRIKEQKNESDRDLLIKPKKKAGFPSHERKKYGGVRMC
jgi:hypothetical protein